jgi:heme-degrading monooxygenase HmoA
MLNVPPVASFHLIRETTMRRNLSRLAIERRMLAATDGLTLWRLCGTGRGDSTAASADLRRRAVFALWRDEADLAVFMAQARLMKQWTDAAESWHVRLAGAGGHGSWRGVDVPSILGGASSNDDRVAIITRANVRARTQAAFSRAAQMVNTEVRHADGLLAVVGFGESPVGRQATFSLWSSLDAATTFARQQPHHADAVRRTRSERWYGEEMFARFVPYASNGTWDGVDPLAR